MSEIDQETHLCRLLPPHLLQQLRLHQQSRGNLHLSDSLVEVLQSYFDPQAEPTMPLDPMLSRLQEMEKRVASLTREMVFLRQELPNHYDRLREQLATVRLSHSGLLQNLRDRLEVLEQINHLSPTPEVPTPPIAQPSYLDLIQPDDDITGTLIQSDDDITGDLNG